MRMISLIAAAALVASTAAYAGPASITPPASGTNITLIQQKKDEGVVKKVERNVKKAWKSLVGHKFVASCPIFFPVNRYECSETGNKEEARAKCAAKHRFCLIQDAG